MNPPANHASALSSQHPWPGLRAFTEQDREFFFGRERETAELLAIVKRSAVVVFYGQSGLGKTSLLQAGLFPQLKQLDFFLFRLRLDHGDDAAPLAQQIKLALSAELDRCEINAPRPGERETLWEYFHRRDLDFWGPRNRLLTPVIVLDQFEEVFTLGQRNENASARVSQFTAELESLIEHRPPDAVRERLELQPEDALNFDFQRQSVKFVLSLREDFLAQLDPWRSRMPSLLAHRFRLERMTGAQALTVVERAGRDLVEPEVAQDIVDFVSTSQRKRTSRSMEQRDVEPALLSVVCDELNLRRLERGQDRITADLLTVEREGIIQAFYERAFEGIDSRMREWVEDELLTASGYRDRAAMEDALKLGLPQKDFDLLVDRRVLHREEREGVVWLELTHDLLTDPAAQSRAAREAKAAANREAEIAKKLSRTRRWAAVFAVLLLGTLSAIALMLVQEHRLKVARESEKRAAEREKTATAAATQAASTAQASFQNAIKAANDLGLDVSEYVRGDMRIPSATIRKVIDVTDASYASLASIEVSSHLATSGDLEMRYARFLTEAAEALYQVGRFDQGHKFAQRALDQLALLRDLADSGKSKDLLRLTQAQALYVQGECLLVNGDLNSARQNFEQAGKLAAQPGESDLKPDMARIFLLSTLEQGETDNRAFKYDSAIAHFDQALRLIKTNKTATDESVVWKAQALMGKAVSQKEDTDGELLLQEAVRTLDPALNAQPNNLRLKRFSAELAYAKGFVAIRLNKLDEAEQFFDQADATSEELTRQDPENLDWRLSLIQSWRGLGMVQYSRGEYESSQEVLERAETAAKELNNQEPSWLQARFLRGAAVYKLGDIVQMKSSAPDGSPDPKVLEKALVKYVEAQTWLQQSAQAAPKNLALLASVIASQAGVYSAQASDKNLSVREKEEKYKKALDLYALARQTLQPIESMEKNSMATYSRWSGDVLMAMERLPEAIALYDKAVQIRLIEVRRSGRPENYESLAIDYESLGYGCVRNHDPARAASEYVNATEAINHALVVRPHNIELLRRKADIYAGIFDLRKSQGDLSGALDAISTSVAAVWGALQDNYSNTSLNSDIQRYRSVLQNTARALEAEKGVGKNDSGPVPTVQSAPTSRTPSQRIQELLAKSDTAQLLEGNQQRAWVLPPLVQGAWRTLGPTELDAARNQLLAAETSLKPQQLLGIRKLPVDFYPDAALYEAQVLGKDGQRGILSYVLLGTKVFMLDGRRDRILAINRESHPRLDTLERASAYLRFYVGAIQSQDGRLALIDQPQDLNWNADSKTEEREQAAKSIRPLVVQSSYGGGWQGIGTMLIAGKLYDASFRLSRTGQVEMVQSSNAVTGTLPVGMEGFLKSVRGPHTEEMSIERLSQQIEADPENEDALRDLPGHYANLQRWKEAMEAQRKLVALRERRARENPEDRQQLADSYELLSWYQLRVGDFAAALTSAEAGKKLDESSLLLEADRAHSLLLLGRLQEAEPIYVKLETTAKAQQVLNDRVTLTSSLRRWKDAAEAESELIAWWQRKPDADGKNRQTISGDYENLAWYQLRAGDFAAALASAEAGKKLDASSVFLDADRAHALLLLGRKPEAEAIYTQLETTPRGEGILGDRVTLASSFKRWQDAAEGQKKLIALIQRNTKDEAELRKRLPGAYLNLSWYQLMTHDFAGALASSEAGHKLDESYLELETNRAHALLFLGRIQEAEALYLKYRDQTVESMNQTWNQVILDDFETLEKEGLTSPEFARLRKLLSAGS